MASTFPINLDRQPQLNMVGSGNFLGSRSNHYAMGQVWCLHVYDYEAEVRINDTLVAITPGCITVTPPYAHVEYHWSAAENQHYTLQFSMPSAPDAAWELQVCYRGRQAKQAAKRLRPCLQMGRQQKRRCEVRIWDVLADLATDRPQVHDQNPKHQNLRAACDYIEDHLHEGINVTDVATAVGISPTHLSRLFRAAHHMNASTWLRRRRMQRAHQLLVAKDRPIKDIAALIGIPDLQHFNKVVREELGQAPRAIRQGARTLNVFSSTGTRTKK